MLVFGFLYLLLGCILPVCSQRATSQMEILWTNGTQVDPSFSLDMARDSVDDMYSTCAAKMELKIKGQIFKKEMENEVFKNARTHAENCANRKMKQIERGDKALTKDHMQAICAYTAGGPADVYNTFNKGVRTGRQRYGSSFPFHSSHFWLTRAVQILNNKNNCYTTYRRTKVNFTGRLKNVIRFGTFTSTSKLTSLINFGETTCFKVKTCHGGCLKKYPTLGDKEQEVLIPPYEMFRIIREDKSGKLDCATLYVLNSTGVESNLDCQIAKNIFL